MSTPGHPGFDALDRELQEMLLEDAVAVFHALYCRHCDLRDRALPALALAGWTEADFMHAVNERLLGGQPGA